MPESELDLTAFAYAYRQLAEAVYRLAPPEPSPFATLLEEHLGQPVSELPVVSMQLDVFDQANLQRAVDALLAEDGVELVQLVGIRGEHRMFGGVTLATLTQRTIRVEPGPVDYIERATDADASVTCIDFGLLLLRIDLERLAILVRRTDERSGGAGLQVEVMTAERRAGAAVLAHLRELMAVHNVFRTKVVSLAPGGPYGTSLDAKFVARPQLTRDDVVLPAGVLERIERMTVGFSGRAQSLRAGGRHLRRGLLLHGQPGAGKTHTVRYLMSRLTGHTVFVLSGQGLGVIPKTVALARQLQPAIVVLEDVDLVAEERTRPLAGTNPVLFELLNQMDGVEQDADITFLLTTNRPDLLEPALASRPGRVDLAVEVPLPAARERRRLLELYAQGLETDGLDWDPVVEGTDGYSAAFLRELLRQAALAAAGDDGRVPRLDDATLSSVLSDLASAAQAMTLRLLGSPQ